VIDLDEMKDKWAEQDKRQEENIRLNRQILSNLTLREGEFQLRRLFGLTALHAAAWFVCAMALGNFIQNHLGVRHLALAAVALDIYAITFLIVLIRQMVMVKRIDYGQPVTAAQKKLEAMRIVRIRTTQWAVIAGVVVWTPALIVVFEALFGLDVYRLFGALWMTANVVFGLALIPVAIWTSRNFGPRMNEYPFIQQVMNDLAGSNLNAAIASLATLSRFEA
jgi:hypothetical protein